LVRLLAGGSWVEAERAVACAGLQSDRLAGLAGAAPYPRIVPFRGDYYVLRPARAHLIRGLVYPVPDPRFPFLGLHFTRRIDGAVWLGPNAVLALAREGYRRRDLDLRDVLETVAYPGFRRLARRHWRSGAAELLRDFSRHAFLAALRRYVPSLRADDMLPGPSGVRAQALALDGTLLDDFDFDAAGGLLNVRNAPSPAATSALAIAREIADRLEARPAAS
ncbi:MAG: FAD-dependent oxidoreductase, partial [Candidatus Limnocylindria bacterium]